MTIPNSNCDKTKKKIKLWQKSKIQTVTKLKYWQKDKCKKKTKTQISTQLKNTPLDSSISDKTLNIFIMSFAWKACHGLVTTLLEGKGHLTEQTRADMSAKSATGVE